jgi:hypothetical protein
MMHTNGAVVSMTFGELLELLGHSEDEFTSLGWATPGESGLNAEIAAPTVIIIKATGVPPTKENYFGINTITGPARTGERGKQEDIARLAVLLADLDIEKCGTWEIIDAIIDKLSEVLGTRPSAITNTGHGRHPLWPILDGHITDDESRGRARAILKRFGRLVEVVAEELGAHVDNVFDLTRVSRVPGSFNNKTNGDGEAHPIRVVTYKDTGRALIIDEVDELLTNTGAVEHDGDRDIGRDVVKAPEDWEWAEHTCPYMAAVIDGWATDSPGEGKGRNPWAASQMVRLECAHRLGCLTEDDRERGRQALAGRLNEALRTTGQRRAMRPRELPDLQKLAYEKASCKTDDECRAELGDHEHLDDLPTFDGPVGGDVDDGEDEAPKNWFVDGATFILTIPETIPAIWGSGDDVLWADGESLMVAGPIGLGKTTLLGMLIAAQLGIGTKVILGLPVTMFSGRILYLAMDRPAQIARALHRQFTDADAEVLASRLVVWKGPPPKDIAKNPELLLKMTKAAGAHMVYVDSVKDAAIKLSDDEVGAGYNKARQLLLREGYQLAEAHHTTKRGPNNSPPTTVADIYGSTWITAGTGSIILMSGDPGDPIVGFRHVRQPMREVGPFQLEHDQDHGVLSIHHTTDLVELARLRADTGLDARTAAGALFGTAKPTAAEVEKARRKLVKLADAKLLICSQGSAGGVDGGTTSVWFPADPVVL